MKLEIDVRKIKTYQKCPHLAWSEKCLVCMFNFNIHYLQEIEEKGLEAVIAEVKSNGNFL